MGCFFKFPPCFQSIFLLRDSQLGLVPLQAGIGIRLRWKDGAVGGGRRKQLGWRRLSSPSTYRPAAPPSASSGSAS